MIDKRVKIIMATALGGQKYIFAECVNSGAFAVISKPLTKEAALNAYLDAAYQLAAGDSA